MLDAVRMLALAFGVAAFRPAASRSSREKLGMPIVRAETRLRRPRRLVLSLVTVAVLVALPLPGP